MYLKLNYVKISIKVIMKDEDARFDEMKARLNGAKVVYVPTSSSNKEIRDSKKRWNELARLERLQLVNKHINASTTSPEPSGRVLSSK